VSHALEALVGGIKDWFQPGQAETRAACRGNAEHVFDPPAESQALKVKKARSAFQIGEVARILGSQAFILAPRCDLEPHHLHQLHVVPLEDPEQIDDLAIEIIGNLEARAKTATQKHSTHTDERLDVGFMRDHVDFFWQSVWLM